MHEPDDRGHNFGPNSRQVCFFYHINLNEGNKCFYVKVDEALRLVDNTLLQLLQGLSDRNLMRCVNLVVLADHGMAEAGPSRVIRPQIYVPNINNLTRYWNGVFPRFEPLRNNPGIYYIN